VISAVPAEGTEQLLDQEGAGYSESEATRLTLDSSEEARIAISKQTSSISERRVSKCVSGGMGIRLNCETYSINVFGRTKNSATYAPLNIQAMTVDPITTERTGFSPLLNLFLTSSPVSCGAGMLIPLLLGEVKDHLGRHRKSGISIASRCSEK
jgi:hypothetical protein